MIVNTGVYFSLEYKYLCNECVKLLAMKLTMKTMKIWCLVGFESQCCIRSRGLPPSSKGLSFPKLVQDEYGIALGQQYQFNFGATI